MVNLRFLLLFAVIFCSGFPSLCQPLTRFNTFTYNVNEGLLQSTIWDIAIDKNNFCWISFPNGIQQFDGNNFRTIKIQAGLPDDKYAKFFRCNNGDMLISHTRGISKYESSSNSFKEIYKQPAEIQRPPIFIGQDGEHIYFYDESATIITIESTSLKITASVKTGMPGYSAISENSPRFSKNIVDHTVAFWMGNRICIWDLKNKKLLYQTPVIANRSPFFLHLLPGKKVLYYSYVNNDALQCWDFTTSVNKKILIQGKDKDNYISRFRTFHWKDKYLVAINNHLYETDSTYLIIKSELVNFQNQPVCGNLGIADLIQDNFGNLYIATINGGIRKIIRNNYPVRYYGSQNKDENKVIGLLPDKKNNRVLVGTSGAGLFIFDTLQRLIKHIPKLPNRKLSFGVNSIVKNNNGEYLLFVMGEKDIWKLKADLNTLTSQPVSFTDTIRHVVNYFGSTLCYNDKQAIVQSMYQLYQTDLASNQTIVHYISSEYTLGKLWYNNKVIFHTNNELTFLDGQTFKAVKKINFPNTGGVRCFAEDEGENILMGTNKGIFKIDSNGLILYHWNKENGLPDECIYAIAVDKNGDIWCSSNKGIFRINRTNNIFQLTKEDGLQENEFNTGVVATAEGGELYFGGMNGVSSFYPSAISSFEEQINILITNIRVNNSGIISDSAIWNINKLTLNYDQNSLSFDFIAMANNNPNQYIYQYRMLGIDKEWIQNSGAQTVRYSLPPGKYTLQLHVSRSFDKGAAPMKEIKITILPPFWKSWWFLSLTTISFISMLAYFINQRNKKKFAEKIQQIENERRLKEERERISRDLHDSLGAYANAVLYNTELLEKENTEEKRKGLIGDLKFASKDIITSLRETVWALKKEKYTAEEAFVRIRNFIQPLTRYYSHIHFRIDGEAPADVELPYSRALNLVRIVQEAVTNSIKHANPAEIIISNTTEAGKWKVSITDNGKGFDYVTAMKAEDGNGLNNMQQRAAASDFILSTHSIPNKGTVVSILI